MDAIIQSISNACACSEEEAREYLNDEVRNLRELRDLNDLRDGDIESACSNLGLELDFMEYFIMQLAC